MLIIIKNEHNNAEKKEIELGEIKPVKPEEENTTVRRPDTFYSQNNVTEFFSQLDQYLSLIHI